MGNNIEVAVVPAAGLATRWLPLTKVVPKELVPLAGRPLIDYLLDEIEEAGIAEVVFVINPERQLLRKYFEPARELAEQLRQRGKQDLVERLKTPSERGIKVSYAFQTEAKGLGHAVHAAAEQVGDRPFAVLLPDEVFISRGKELPLGRLIEGWQATGDSCLAVQKVAWEKVSAYGIVSPSDDPHDDRGGWSINGMVEKPDRQSAPSQYSVVGRYVLRAEVMAALEHQQPGALAEIQLTDAIAATINKGVRAVTFPSVRLDCGTIQAHAEANHIVHQWHQ